jgi:hypothetical protein
VLASGLGCRDEASVLAGLLLALTACSGRSDPAPFRLSATNDMADAIDSFLQDDGITDADIAGFSAVERALATARPDLIPTMLAGGLISPALALYLAQLELPDEYSARSEHHRAIC